MARRRSGRRGGWREPRACRPDPAGRRAVPEQSGAGGRRWRRSDPSASDRRAAAGVLVVSSDRPGRACSASWDETQLVEGEVVGAALRFDEELCVRALAVVDEGEGDGLVDVQERADRNLVPGGISMVS